MKLKKLSDNRFLLLIPAIAFIFVSPGIFFGSGGTDLVFHTLWTEHFSNQLWSGILYPRWLEEMNAGCGEPVFFLYPPLIYYVTSIFAPLSDILPHWWYPFLIVGFLLINFTAYFFFIWARQFVDEFPALLGAIAYVMMPYVWFDYYFSFSYSQMLTFMWLPIILYHTRQIALKGEFDNAVYLACFYALQLFSSLPGSIIVSVFLPFYFLFCCKKNEWVKHGSIFASAILAGCALAAVYLLPLISELKNVLVGNDHMLKSTMFNYADHFITTFDNMPLLFIAVMSVIAVFSMWISMSRRKQKLSRELKFWIAIFFIALFMALPISKPLWATFSFIQAMRYPMRFLILMSFATAAIICFLMQKKRSKKESEQAIWGFFAGVICVLIPLGILFTEFSRKPLEGTPIGENHAQVQKYYRYNASIFFEYLPRNVDPDQLLINRIDETHGFCQRKAFVQDGLANIEIIRWQPRDIEFNVEAMMDSNIVVTQFTYPGWVAKDKTTGNVYEIKPEKKHGAISLNIPKGNHSISLTLPKKTAEIIGILISSISLLALFFVYIIRRRN